MSRYPTILVAVFAIALGSCGKKQELTSREAKGGKRYGGRYTLNEIRGNPTSLDPVRMTTKVEDDIGTNIFDKLIDNNSELQLVPELAKSWDVSADGLAYTFHLRSDAHFHDDECFPNGKGRTMTSADVLYSFQRACDPHSLTAGFWIFQDIVAGADDFYHDSTGRVKSVSGFVASDDTTFICKLTKPFAPFLEHLTTSFAYVVPHEAVEKYGKDFFRHPIGTGPFKLTSWKPDQEIVLKRNPNYWQFDSAGNQLPLLDEIVFTMIKDDKTLLAKFERGETDEDFTLPTENFRSIVSEDKKLAASYQYKAVLQHVPALNSYFMDFLCTGRLFSNTSLRRALSFGVDRAKIVKYVLKGAPHGIADHGIVPPAFERYPIDVVHGITYNADSAHYWLSKAGYPNGKGLAPIKLAVYNEPRPMQIAEAVQAQWKDLGVNCELEVMQSGLLLDASDEGKLDLWLTRWYADYPEIENFLNLFNGRLVPKNPSEKSYPNNTRWNNEDYNSLFYQALATTDETQRLKLYAQAENVAASEAPNIPLFYEEHYRLLQPNVRDNPLDAMNRIDLKTVWLAK